MKQSSGLGARITPISTPATENWHFRDCPLSGHTPDTAKPARMTRRRWGNSYRRRETRRSRQMARHLRRNGWCVGRHRVRRLMLKMGLAQRYPTRVINFIQTRILITHHSCCRAGCRNIILFTGNERNPVQGAATAH